MKKGILFLLVFVMVFCLTACGKDKPEPTVSGTQGSTQSGEKETQPTTSTGKPTAPTTQPTAPTTQPTQPTTQPTEPATQPTEPATQPTEPATQPTEPTTQPTEPTTQPTEPATQPTAPTTQPTQPTTQPTEPPHTHSYTQSVTNPDCTNGGYTTNTCACGDSYRSDEKAALGHSFVDGKCSACNEVDPSYKALNTGKWINQSVIDSQLYDIAFLFHTNNTWNALWWNAGLGVDINTLDATFRNELLAHRDEVKLPEVDGKLYYVGMGDGGPMSCAENGNMLTVTLNDFFVELVFERTAGNQLTLREVTGDLSGAMEGFVKGSVYTWCEE